MGGFDPRIHMHSQGQVYNKVSGRWLGPIDEFESAPVKSLSDRTKDELLELAKRFEVQGTSRMTKAELVEALDQIPGAAES